MTDEQIDEMVAKIWISGTTDSRAIVREYIKSQEVNSAEPYISERTKLLAREAGEFAMKAVDNGIDPRSNVPTYVALAAEILAECEKRQK